MNEIVNPLNPTKNVVDIDWVFKNGDPRVESYPTMESPNVAYVSVFVFVVFIKIIAPKMMEHRKPYILRSAMLIYNVVLVALSGWMFYRFTAYGWLHKYNWRCEPIDFSNDEAAVKILEAYYVYYLSKYIEFIDTIFFALRKKYSQITFLHLFHHSYMPICSWYFVKYSGGGYATVIPLANTFTHVIMYSYYLLSSLGPSVQKYIWWKRHITNIQMIQFTFVFVHSSQVMLFPLGSCKATYFTAGLSCFTACLFFCLFTPFYIDEYIKKKENKIK